MAAFFRRFQRLALTAGLSCSVLLAAPPPSAIDRTTGLVLCAGRARFAHRRSPRDTPVILAIARFPVIAGSWEIVATNSVSLWGSEPAARTVVGFQPWRHCYVALRAMRSGSPMADFRAWLRPARLETREARCVLTVSNATRRPHRSGDGASIAEAPI